MKSAVQLFVAGAISISASLFGVGAALAQGACPLCGSQVPVKSIDKAIYDSLQAHGLVRGTALLVGQMNNYEYVGAGTMVDLEAATLGAAVPVSRYVYNAHQQLWASRQEFQGPNTQRTIRVVKGNRAWDESWYEEKTKLGTVKKIKTSPADAAVKLRAQLLWIQPQMFISHVAFAAGKKCLVAEIKECDTKWSKGEDAGKTTFTVEIGGQTYKGVLDGNKRVASVETQVTLPSGGGAKTIIAKYSGYRVGETEDPTMANLAAVGDKSLDKNHNGVFWPSKVSYELDGKNVLDLVISEGWNNPYTIFPEPELLAQAQ